MNELMLSEGSIIFGAGKWGRILADVYYKVGIKVDFFCDNNKSLWGTFVNGIKVISPNELSDIRDGNIIVVNKYADEIVCQLSDMSIDEKRIYSYNHLWNAIYDISSLLNLTGNNDIPSNGFDRILFLLSNGLAMGGVETWSVNECAKLNCFGKKAAIVYEEGKNEELDVLEQEVITVPSSSSTFSSEYYLGELQIIMSEAPCVVVCNFGGESAGPSFVVKRILGDAIRCIFVIHSDDDVYYNTCMDAIEEIDYCVVVSDEIEKKIIERGFPRDRIKKIVWQIPITKKISIVERNNKCGVRIGYAGRVTTSAKNCQLIPEIVKMLIERKVDFELSIAGKGDYYDVLNRMVIENLWGDNVKLLGIIEHEKIAKFWQNQDIMISVSDYEGHSISQCEAMAEGAVPIVTDVSGVRDDINHGENGFVVECGDVGAIVDYIELLSNKRDLLYKMGIRAQKTIEEKFSLFEHEKFWAELLSNN